jgi:ferredoxin
MFNISKNRCIGCGLCRNICPEQIILDIKKGISVIKKQDEECLKKAVKICPQKAIKEIKQDLLFAIGTDDKEKIKSDDHIGESKYFQIWKFSAKTGKLSFIVTRENSKYRENENRIHGDPNKAEATSSVIEDIDVLVGKIFGPNILRIKNKFVCAVIREPKIKKAIEIIKGNINEIIEEQEKEEKKGIILQ